MPCILKVRIVAARDLPVMDKASELTDAYVEVKFADHDTERTQVCRRTLNPIWNEDFRFEVSDEGELQDEPLQVRVMDYDALSANDAIGTVYVDLNALLAWEADAVDDSATSSEGQINGWFPIYDSLRGLRGDLHIQVKLQFFGDVNPFKDSSAGVQIFSSPALPAGYRLDAVLGFVDVLVNEDDPEYHWRDTFRAPRVSNEARQKVLYGLSGELRRQIGRQVLELGGNAIVGFKQCFDMETEECVITGRAIGTCVKLSVIEEPSSRDDDEELSEHDNLLASSPKQEVQAIFPTDTVEPSPADTAMAVASLTSPDASMRHSGKRVMSDPLVRPHVDVTSVQSSPEPFSPEIDAVSTTGRRSLLQRNALLPKSYRDRADIMLITLDQLPKGCITNIGGIVSARSVKLYQTDEEEERDAWWDELREELRSHAKALGCVAVLGYTETATIHDELCVLSAVGTAANIDLRFLEFAYGETEIVDVTKMSVITSLADTPKQASVMDERPLSASKESNSVEINSVMRTRMLNKQNLACQACHIPYHRKTIPFQMSFAKCALCKKKYVPEVLFSNIQPPSELETIADSTYIEAHICRSKKNKEGETNATIVSDALPFIEYDIHRQLMYKMRIQGLNAIFGLKFRLAIGDSLIIAVASGTAMYLAALPSPPPLRIARNLEVVDAEDRQLLAMQKKIMDLSDQNRQKIESARLSRFTSDNSLPNVAEAKDESSLAGSQVLVVDPQSPVTMDSNPASNPTTRPDTPLSSSMGGTEPIPIPTRPRNKKLDAKSSSPTKGSIGGLKSSLRRQHTAATIMSSDESDSDSSGSDSSSDDDEARQKTNIVVQIDDDADEDLMAVLLDPSYTEFVLCNTEVFPSMSAGSGSNLGMLARVLRGDLDASESSKFLNMCAVQMINVVKEGSIKSIDHHPNRQLAAIFRGLYEDIQSAMAFYHHCIVVGIEYDILLPKDEEIHIRMTALAIGQHSTDAEYSSYLNSLRGLALVAAPDDAQAPHTLVASAPVASSPAETTQPAVEDLIAAGLSPNSSSLGMTSPTQHYAAITPLSYVPGGTIIEHRGRISLHFVREDLYLHHRFGHHHADWTNPESQADDDLGRFIHRFISEVLAVCRAHTLAFGGNAIVSFRIEQNQFQETLKNQGYGVLSVSGDVVDVQYSANPLRSRTPLMGVEMVDMLWHKYQQ